MLDGDTYEARSAELLERQGLRIIARQYRCRRGEIDLIATDDQRLIFVEVRARSRRSHGGAAASVDRRKQCKLARCAAFFLSQQPQWSHLPCRFDVIVWEPAATAATDPMRTSALGLSRRQSAGKPRQSTPSPLNDSPGGVSGPCDTLTLEPRWLQAAFVV